MTTLHTIQVTNHALNSVTFTGDDPTHLKSQVADYIGEYILFAKDIEDIKLLENMAKLAICEWVDSLDIIIDDVQLRYELKEV
jgi:hypothetical protein